jgi:peptide/nickel transport system ATP-binding protein/oligopeptide transport system ATP-binding protein
MQDRRKVDPAPPDAASQTADRTLLAVRNLKTYYPVRGGMLRRQVGWVKAVDDVSFAIKRGETFGLVGESGCGKTTLGRSIIRLIQPRSGHVLFEGKDILNLDGKDLKAARRDMQIIFQDPYGSLNPRMSVGDIIGEGLLIHRVGNRREREETVATMLSVVGLRKEYAHRRPHEFSGGQRQRIGIARALALRPKFVVGDEPVSSLDVSIQSQVLNLLKDLQREFGLTYLFIAHDLSVVEYISDRVGVMYLGKLVELASAEDLYANPRMPYTQALVSAIPVPDPTVKKKRIVLQGDVPSPVNPPSGCPFRTRCWLAQQICAEQMPPLREVAPNHWAACHFA